MELVRFVGGIWKLLRRRVDQGETANNETSSKYGKTGKYGKLPAGWQFSFQRSSDPIALRTRED